MSEQNEVEIHLDTSGGVRVVGYGEPQLLQAVGVNQYDGKEEKNNPFASE